MKNYLLSIIFLIGISTLNAQNVITKNYKGKIVEQGLLLELILNLTKNQDNTYTASWDVPAQHAKDLKASSVVVTDSSIVVEVKSMYVVYEGKFSPDQKSIKGRWKQNGVNLALNLESFTKVEEVVLRKQTPKAPFPYQTEDFTFQGKKTGLTYGATLTTPTNAKNFPAIILITGSGQQDRNETLLDHQSFFVIADYLTRQGYAILRVDDRGIGKTTGNFENSTSEDFAQDVEEQFTYLKTIQNIDSTKIGLMGHSEGGLIAPLVAARNKEIAFIVLLAGPGIPIIDLMAEQNEKILLGSGLNEKVVEAYSTLYKKLFPAILNSSNKTDAFSNGKVIVDEWRKTTDTNFVKWSTNITNDVSENEFITSFIDQLYSPWWKYFGNFNPQEYLKQVQCPILALNGDKDVQVIAKSNLEGIKSSSKKGKNKNVKTVELKDLNHLFQTCNSGMPREYATLEETFSPIALIEISNWLAKINH